MTAQFRKYHALGNDYIVIDPKDLGFTPLPEAIKAICDRNTGAGSDGILLGPLAGKDDLRGFAADSFGAAENPWLRIFNPDGSEAEKSGNGLRIFCLYLAERGYVGRDEFFINTLGGRVSAQVQSLDPASIRVDMGRPSFSARLAGLSIESEEFIQGLLDVEGEKVRASFVSMGNPHCVVLTESPTAELARRLGPKLEQHPLFPHRTNVQFLKVLDRHTIQIEIWERGAGYTLASGSSSCAAASVAKRLGFVEGEVTVIMPGGRLLLDLSRESVRMTGPAIRVYDGRFSRGMEKLLYSMGAISVSV